MTLSAQAESAHEHLLQYNDVVSPVWDGLVFSPGGHRYLYKDRVVPSVTQILEGVGHINKKFFPPGAAARGASIHALTAYLDRGEAPLSFFRGAMYYDVLTGWDLFTRMYEPSFQGVELITMDKDALWAGTIDRVCTIDSPSARQKLKLDKGQVCYLDLKTGLKQAWHALQLEGYRQTADNPKDVAIFGVYISMKKPGAFEAVRFYEDLSGEWFEAVSVWYGKTEQCYTKEVKN